MTNLDKIREIDSDGLAYFLTDVAKGFKPWCKDEDCEREYSDADCVDCCEKWLWEEVDEDAFS